MNARERIARALAEADGWHLGAAAAPAATTDYGRLADAVLAVLPDLLTDPDVTTASAEWSGFPHIEAVAVLNAAARVLTEGGAT